MVEVQEEEDEEGVGSSVEICVQLVLIGTAPLGRGVTVKLTAEDITTGIISLAGQTLSQNAHTVRTP